MFYSYYEIHKSVLLLLVFFMLSGCVIVTTKSGRAGVSEKERTNSICFSIGTKSEPNKA